MLTWQEKLDSLAERLGEPDLFSANTNTEQLTPYFDPVAVENWLYKASLYYLRTVPVRELEAVGSYAIAFSGTSVASGVYITNVSAPLGAFRVIYVQLTRNGIYIPGEFISQAEFMQMLSVTDVAIGTLIGGKVAVKGPTSFRIAYLVEPSLSIFQQDAPVLPPGYDEDVITRARQYAMISDFLPAGKL